MAPSSSTTTTTVVIPATVRLLQPTSNVIPLLSNPPAQIYGKFVHTAIVASFYLWLRAKPLVPDPLTTMTTDLLPLALVQGVFCSLCLPVAGAWTSGTGNPVQTGGGSAGGKKKAGTSGKVGASGSGGGNEGVTSISNRIMQTLLALVLTFILPPIPLTVLALCLGAPLYPTSQLPHTLILSLHVSLLGFLPLFYTHGVSASAWRDVIAAWLPFDEAGVWAGAVGCLVGGWIGAIPIALDWDREWQKWPCTVLWGVVLGWSVGRILTSTLRLGLGKRIDLSEKSESDDNLTPFQEHVPDGNTQLAKTMQEKRKKKTN